MNERELAMRALGLTSPYEHPERVDALLELLNLARSQKYQCSMPKGHLNLAEDTCTFCTKEYCWLNAPDTITRCDGKCEGYKEKRLV